MLPVCLLLNSLITPWSFDDATQNAIFALELAAKAVVPFVNSVVNMVNVITREYYLKLLDTAWKLNKKKIYYIMKTIAQTGIRVGELKYVTVEAIQVGITIVWNKEKYRNVYLTNKLCEELKIYCSDNNISEGPIFCGNKKGQTITNGAVWRSLKYIAIQAGIPQELVYPHSFRHLFAKEYMRKIGDISELADLLGHTRLETTWIYTKTTSEEKRVRLEHLDL